MGDDGAHLDSPPTLDKRSLVIAAGLAMVGVGLLRASLSWGSWWAAWPGCAALLLAFLFGGGALAPDGNRRRGTVRGALAYLGIGTIVVVGQYLAQDASPFTFGPLLLLQIAIWPMMVLFGGPGLG